MTTRKQTATDKQAPAIKAPTAAKPPRQTSPGPPGEARPDESLQPAARATAGVNKATSKGPMGNGPIEGRGRSGRELVDDTVDLVKRSSTGEDEPMGEEQPQAPFAIVGLSYFIVLALFGLILGWLYFIVF